MEMFQDGERVHCLPDEACCIADEEKRSPLELDKCPIGFDECDGACTYYAELY